MYKEYQKIVRQNLVEKCQRTRTSNLQTANKHILNVHSQ